MKPSPRREGFTLTETLITAAVLVVVATVGQSLLFASTTSTARTLRRDDSLRSVETVLELLRSDLNRMLVLDPSTDLAIHDNGAGLSFRVPERDAADFWEIDLETIDYSVEAVKGKTACYRLVRKTPTGTTVIGGCLLERFSVRLVSAGEISPNQSFLEITVTGRSNEQGGSLRWASALVPITMSAAPLPYLAEAK